MLDDIVTSIAVVAVLWLAFFFMSNMMERRRMQKRIERLKLRKTSVAKVTRDLSLRRKTTEHKGLIYWLSKPLPDFKRLGDRLERAGLNITPKQYVMRRLLFVAAFVFASMFLGKSPVTGLFLGIILGVWLPFKMMKRKINKQAKAFLLLFPDGIDLIVRGLRSGLPVSESMVLVAQEVPDPVKSVFENIHNTMKLGVSLEKALQETARKLDMTEFNFFTTSIVLQRETGGNLSEILSNLSDVLRSRFMMRMKIKAMSSEARASSYIIGALPFLVLAAVSVLTPAYILPLINDYRGNVWAAIAAGMMISGMWIMNRMTNFEI